MSDRKEPTIQDYKVGLESLILHQTTMTYVALENLGSIFRVNIDIINLIDENRHLYSEEEIAAIRR